MSTPNPAHIDVIARALAYAGDAGDAGDDGCFDNPLCCDEPPCSDTCVCSVGASGGSVESQWAYINTIGFPVENRFTKAARRRYPVLVGPPLLIPATATAVTWYLDFQGMGTFRWRNAALQASPAF